MIMNQSTSQIPARINLALLHERLIQSSHHDLAQRTVRRKNFLELNPCLLRLRCVARLVPTRARATADDTGDADPRVRDDARERVRHDQVTQLIARREQAAPERVRGTGRVLQRPR